MTIHWLFVLSLLPLEKRWDNFQTKHAWAEVPEGWVIHDTEAPKDHIVKMRIGLKQDRFGDLVEELYEVSDPRHERCVQTTLLPQCSVSFFSRFPLSQLILR